ncbi:hypothetical protein C0W54_08505 [Photobacterium kishitanii]|uniref:hypothetical protein n=1 Tax=Photobacterium kishitanii TaxID=318456 RepID=UPI000D174CB5|nr:hypothetical protein [Photobacterium kishitanii]PSW61873.1 hypothetical protein C0W54_08505 [Photobacterium kishitanii]
MQKIISFLEKNDSNWILNKDSDANFIHVAESFGYEFKISKTKNEVGNFLKEKLKECLTGDDVSYTQFGKIEDHISLKYYSSQDGEFEAAFVFISFIRSLINVLDSYSNSIESWMLAKKYVEALYSLDYDFDHNNFRLFEEQKLISKSINYLRSKKYNIIINDGNAYLDTDSEKRIFSVIDYKLTKSGEQSIFFIMMMLSKKYDSRSKRYFLRPELTLLDQIEVDIPWGYLFNVCLSKLYLTDMTKKKSKVNANIEHFDDAVNLVKHYFCLQRIQSFNKYADMYYRYDTIIPAIKRNILYDQHFSIDQISNDHALKMIDGMFNSSLLEKFDVNINIYIDIMRWIFSKPNDKPYLFSIEKIYYELFKYNIDELKIALDYLSHDINTINKGYLYPNDIIKRNYYKKPFIKRKENYIYINSNFMNYGFYFSLLSLYTEKGVNGDTLGKVAEEFVESQFLRNSINYISNKEYKISKEIAKELKIRSQKKECDYILETENSIVFIELKRKTLTSNSRSGDALTSIVDISQSLFHALAQAGCHEYILRRDGQIVFNDGTKIELKNRKIEKVALTLFGFFGIQDGLFVHQILNSLINAELKSEDESKNKIVNKLLNELKNQYETKIFQDETSNGMTTFFNCRFFSVPQLIEILRFCSNNDEFLLELNRTRHISTGCKDWFKEYFFYRELYLDSENN